MVSNLILRTISIAVLAPVVTLILYLGGVYFQVFALTCLCLMLNEWFSMNNVKKVPLAILMGVFVVAYGVFIKGMLMGKPTFQNFLFLCDYSSKISLACIIFIVYGICIINNWKKLLKFITVLASIAAVALAIFVLMHYQKRPIGCPIAELIKMELSVLVPMISALFLYRAKKDTTLFATGIIYISLPMVFWIMLSGTPALFERCIVLSLTVVWSCDIFAYLGGRLIGGPKLAPSISPKKTWSGAIAGTIGAMSAVYILHKMRIGVFNYNIILISLATIGLAIASIFGDLLESKAKRMLGVKDSGNIIPGHGGICDRLDSFLMVSYVFIGLAILMTLYSDLRFLLTPEKWV